MKSGSKQRDMQAAVNSQPMNKLESIKERFNMYDFVHTYIDENGCNQEWGEAHTSIRYLLQRVERYEVALKEANTIIHDYKEARGYRERQVLEIADIIKEALKE